MVDVHEDQAQGTVVALGALQFPGELLLEVPRDEVARLVPALRETMEGALALDVPLTVDVKTGDDWESMTVVPRGAEA